MLGNPTIIHDFPVFKPILKGFNRLFKIYKCEKKLADQRSNDALVWRNAGGVPSNEFVDVLSDEFV